MAVIFRGVDVNWDPHSGCPLSVSGLHEEPTRVNAVCHLLRASGQNVSFRQIEYQKNLDEYILVILSYFVLLLFFFLNLPCSLESFLAKYFRVV